jgi:hypothetical protein
MKIIAGSATYAAAGGQTEKNARVGWSIPPLATVQSKTRICRVNIPYADYEDAISIPRDGLSAMTHMGYAASSTPVFAFIVDLITSGLGGIGISHRRRCNTIFHCQPG